MSLIIEKLKHLVLRIKQIFIIPIYPCYEPFLAMRFAQKAINLQKKMHFDLIFAEHNGFTSLYAGYCVKKAFPDVKFMAVLWDPFTVKEPAKYLPKAYAYQKITKCDARILGIADVIVSMAKSEEYHKVNSINKLYFYKYRFLGILGIVQPERTGRKAIFIEKGKINIVYAGF